jgi:hypothetical protein
MAENKVPFSLRDSLTVIATIAAVVLLYKLLKVVGIIPTSEKQEAKEEAKEQKEKEREEKLTARFDEYQRYTTADGLYTVAKLYSKETGKPVPTKNSLTVLFGVGVNERTRLIATKIYESKGTFNDDENTLYSAFRDLLTVGELHSVNFWFENLYKKGNVFNYVRGFTNEKERNKIATILDLKPYYLGNKRK